MNGNCSLSIDSSYMFTGNGKPGSIHFNVRHNFCVGDSFFHFFDSFISVDYGSFFYSTGRAGANPQELNILIGRIYFCNCTAEFGGADINAYLNIFILGSAQFFHELHSRAII
ncbi:MAG TPA: hypothetical protein EYN82_05835 [Candidatus Marinimicrobia bacterium]|nr:hypothetical protein [Candidatus Neomarinimicrobiota bacterium]